MISSNSCQHSVLLTCSMSAPKVTAFMASFSRSLVETFIVSLVRLSRSSVCSFSSRVCIVSVGRLVLFLMCLVNVVFFWVSFRSESIKLRSMLKVKPL